MPYTSWLVPVATWVPDEDDVTALEGEDEIAAATLEGASVPQAGDMTQGTDISLNIVCIKVVTAADADTTSVVAAAADAIAAGEGIDDEVTSVVLDDGSVFPDTPFRAIIGTEVVNVTDVTTNTLTIERGFGGTTPAAHLAAAAVTQYIDEDTTVFDLDDGSNVVEGQVIKIGTAGTELILITDVSTNRITVQRGWQDSAKAVIADAGEIWRVIGPEGVETAIAAAATSVGMRQLEGYFDLAG